MSLRDLIEREQLLDNLYSDACRLNDHELRVLCRCARGLIKGQTKYSEWNPKQDKRNLAEEALQESLDQSVYLSMLSEKDK